MRGRHEAEGCGLRDLEQRKLGVSFLLEGRVNTVLTIEVGEKHPHACVVHVLPGSLHAR